MINSNLSATVALMNDPSATELECVVNGRLKGRVRGFQLIVKSEGVILRGTARSYYFKQLAQHLVMEATTMRIVANEIDVVSEEAS